ncbi:MerR family DNA-binding protein [Bdellovibrionota bacterium FG-1]
MNQEVASQLTIGRLAKAAGVGIETVRFYERKGLLRKPSARLGAFRAYSPQDVDRVQFIKRAQTVGFTLRDIADLLRLEAGSGLTCSQLLTAVSTKLTDIQSRILDLKRMEAALKELEGCCAAQPSSRKPTCFLTTCFSKEDQATQNVRKGKKK